MFVSSESIEVRATAETRRLWIEMSAVEWNGLQLKDRCI